MMTEEEIVTQLKRNWSCGVVLAFMPQEVKDWVRENTEYCFYFLGSADWRSMEHGEQIDEEYAHALPPTFTMSMLQNRRSQERETSNDHWVEYVIDEDGFFTLGDIDSTRYHWSQWQRALVNNLDTFLSWGGWYYSECDFAWFMHPQLIDYDPKHADSPCTMNRGTVNDGDEDWYPDLPGVPTKIRFWRR